MSPPAASTHDLHDTVAAMPTSTRSTFVTVVGWIFAVFSGFGLLISVMQNIMLHTVFPIEQMPADIPADFPGMARFMFEHFSLLVLIPLLISGVMLAASVGLIKRREWARKLLLVLAYDGWFVPQGHVLSHVVAGRR